MLQRPSPHFANSPNLSDISRDEVDALQASCREIAAKGGEVGEIANRILNVSLTLDALNAKADEFLSRYRSSAA
jgi:hypothetical protein